MYRYNLEIRCYLFTFCQINENLWNIYVQTPVFHRILSIYFMISDIVFQIMDFMNLAFWRTCLSSFDYRAIVDLPTNHVLILMIGCCTSGILSWYIASLLLSVCCNSLHYRQGVWHFVKPFMNWLSWWQFTCKYWLYR